MTIQAPSLFGAQKTTYVPQGSHLPQDSAYMYQGGAGAGAPMGGNGYETFTAVQQRILSMVGQFGRGRDGMNIPQLAQKMAPEGYSEAQIRWVY